MKKVLIVDDSKTIQRLLEGAIKSRFQIVGKGSNGLEGYDLYRELRPDAVLLDITMPNCNGKECLEKIIAFDQNATVIMVSGLDDPETIEACINIGAKAFVKKMDLSAGSAEGESRILQTLLEWTKLNEREAA